MDHWTDASSPAELEKALAGRQFAEADALVGGLLEDLDRTRRRMDARAAKKVLTALRAHAWFDALHDVADRLQASGQREPELLRQLGQARIEQGAVTRAIEGLLELEKELRARRDAGGASPIELEKVEFELGETLGLLGRAYKQLYVDAAPTAAEPRTPDLEQSIRYYRTAFDARWGDYLWHGVNCMALVAHAERVGRGQPNAAVPEAEAQAKAILQGLDDLPGPPAPWDLANRAESLLALGRYPEAIEAVREYLDHPQLVAFNIQSTRRQFEQLWMLTEDEPPGATILPMMTARLAEVGGADRGLVLRPESAGRYEKVFGDTRYRPVEWLRRALQLAGTIARLGPDRYEGDGTGFLFDGSWIAPGLADRPLLLTNAHVASPDEAERKAYPYPADPETLTAVFLGREKGGDAFETPVTGCLWHSRIKELDATLLELEKAPDGVTLPELGGAPPSAGGDGARVNVMGHPHGRGLTVSLQDNRVVALGDRVVHYRTPTDPGSSGSPVFDQEWRLVALHHASHPAKQANEGIRMDRILEAMRRDLS